jgi:molybdopterin-guanine dinucleotide biosynthesis adapter protein
LVEGYKSEKHTKMEVYRTAVGKDPLYPVDKYIVAIASDPMIAGADIPVVDLNDIEAVGNTVLASAEPLETLLARLGDS